MRIWLLLRAAPLLAVLVHRQVTGWHRFRFWVSFWAEGLLERGVLAQYYEIQLFYEFACGLYELVTVEL